MSCCADCRVRLMKELSELGMLKSKVEEKRIVLPYVGLNELKCRSLRYEHGLYVQCNRECSSGYCERCRGERLRGVDYGDVNLREKVGLMDYVDPKGRKVVHYRKVMKKLNISEEKVKEECRRLGIELASVHMEEVKSKRGRPRKEVIVSDTDSEGEKKEKKKRGRPRKEKKKEEIKTGKNIIEELVSNNEEKKEREKEEEEEEEETEVCEFSLNGKVYLKSDKNVLYDIVSHEIIGIWVESRNSIEEYEE